MKPGDSIVVDFTTHDPSTGAATDADSTPSGTLVRNGTDTAESVTVTNKATGVYKASVDIPGGYSAGDVVQVRIEATVDSTTGNAVIFSTVLDSKRVGELNDLSAAEVNAEADTALADYGASTHDDPDPSGHIDAAISSRSSHDDPDPSGHIDAAISSRSSHDDPGPDIAALNDLSEAQVKTQADQALTDYAPSTHDDPGPEIAALNDPTADAIVAAIEAGLLGDWADGGRLDLLLDAVKAQTDQLAFSSGDVIATVDGEEVTVGDIAVAALAKFATQDTGETEAADGSVATLATGETASLTASAIWTYATRTLTELAVSSDAYDVLTAIGMTVHRGDTFTRTWNNLSLSDADKIWFTLKTQKADADSDALVQIDLATGLLYAHGEAAEDATQGAISNTDTSVTVVIDKAITAGLAPAGAVYYDIQKADADGDVTTLVHGEAEIVADITRATS